MNARRWIFAAIALFATALVIAAGVELAATLWLHVVADEEQFIEYASLEQLRERYGDARFGKFARHRYLGYYPAPDYQQDENRHNALGYRGDPFPLEKPQGEFRIVLLGGSTTYTSFVRDYRQSFPHVLQQELHARGYPGVRVINAGVPGYSSYESLINFELRALDLEPDMVIVYHGVNDAIARLVWPESAYRGDNSGFLRPGTEVSDAPFYERSNAVRIFRIRGGWSLSPASLERTFSLRAATSFHGAFVAQKRNGVYPRGLFTKTPAAEIFERMDPRYFRRNLEHIGAIARQRGIVPVFTSFAWCELKTDDPLASAEYVAAMSEQNEVSRAVAALLDAPFYDFAAEFPDDPQIFVGAVHLNAKGARLKAERFADYLAGSGLLEGER